MNKTMLVRYKYSKADKYGDLVCDLTEFFDKYIPNRNQYSFYKTYLYNDIGIFSNLNYLQIAFRVPGATRGGIFLSRLNENQFMIKDIHFNEDCCFGNIGCYDRAILEDSKQLIGCILDFSNVCLRNNKI